MSIAIIGATGFVGRELLGKLSAERKDVVPVVRRDYGLPSERVCGDIHAHTDWRAALAGVGTAIHLAARVHVMNDKSADPLQQFRRVNRDGVLNAARQAASLGVRRFIFISTVKVNGEKTPAGRPFTAADLPQPTDPYAVSKFEAEEGLLKLGQETGMEVVIIRPPLVYGPGVKGNFRSVLNWVRRGFPLPLGGVTSNQRSLVGVSNLVDLISLCVGHPAAAGQIFLVSDDRDLSTAELLHKVASASGRKARLIPIPPPWIGLVARLLGKSAAADRLFGNLQLDISKTKEMLGWNPPVTIEEELKRTVAV